MFLHMENIFESLQESVNEIVEVVDTGPYQILILLIYVGIGCNNIIFVL